MAHTVGIVSDTHGYVDPRLETLFAAVDLIIHAGDVGSPEVVDVLSRIAPVVAVRGNADRDPRLVTLPEKQDLILGTTAIHVVHRLQDASPQEGSRVIVHGHSHRVREEWREHILYLNPGAADRQGFHRERTALLLRLDEELTVSLLRLGPKARERIPVQGRSDE